MEHTSVHLLLFVRVWWLLISSGSSLALTHQFKRREIKAQNVFRSKLFWILTYFFCHFLLLSRKNAEEFSFIMRHCSAAGVLHGEARILPIMCRARRHGNTMYLYIIVPLYTDTHCFCQTVKKPPERQLRTSVGNVGGSLSIFCSSEDGSRLERIWGLMYCDFHWNDSNRDDLGFFFKQGKKHEIPQQNLHLFYF